MESYLEITWLHNLLILLFSFKTALTFTHQCISKWRVLLVSIGMSMIASILFIENSTIYMALIEIILFLVIFRHCMATYLIFVSMRFLLHLIYMLLFFGTIYNNQYFVFEAGKVMMSDAVLFFIYEMMVHKGKYAMCEHDFIVPFKLFHKTYQGYIDSGNLATYQTIPIIFVKDELYERFTSQPIELDIGSIRQHESMQGFESEIIISHKKIKVICCRLACEFPYDALLNMKGLL